MKTRILVVEQTEGVRAAFVAALQSAEFDVCAAKSVPEAAEQFAKHGASIVVLDLLLVDGDALVFMAGVLGALPNTRIITTTASGAMRQAAAAVEQGAFDYLVKPIESNRLVAVVENAALPSVSKDEDKADYHRALFGEDLARIYRFAASAASVLIEGEEGSGKRACAEVMHSGSFWANMPFVAVDCDKSSAVNLFDLLDDSALEHGGTLYLSEPSRLSLAMQTQVLRFLQNGQIGPQGSESTRAAVRLICGMSFTPEDAVDAGQFREDLFYRLKVMRISLHPLRARSRDVPLIASSILRSIARRLKSPMDILAADVGIILGQLYWAGNVMQLHSVLETIVQNHEGPVLKSEMLPDVLLNEFVGIEYGTDNATGQNRMESADSSISDLVRAGWSLTDLERLLIETAISQHGGSIPKAADQLNVSPSTLYRKKENWELKST